MQIGKSRSPVNYRSPGNRQCWFSLGWQRRYREVGGFKIRIEYKANWIVGGDVDLEGAGRIEDD